MNGPQDDLRRTLPVPQVIDTVDVQRKGGAVYIMTNRSHRVLYTGVTADLPKRVYEHKNSLVADSFTARYRAHELVYFELHEDIQEAIQREKQIKGWLRRKKTALIESLNPSWADLSDLLSS